VTGSTALVLIARELIAQREPAALKNSREAQRVVVAARQARRQAARIAAWVLQEEVPYWVHCLTRRLMSALDFDWSDWDVQPTPRATSNKLSAKYHHEYDAIPRLLHFYHGSHRKHFAMRDDSDPTVEQAGAIHLGRTAREQTGPAAKNAPRSVG
jgi:hypothetical protein